jgi:hypothetical protein
MEIPFSFARNSEEALGKASVIRDEMRAKIAGHSLFEDTTAPLKPMETIALAPAVKGRFDHFAVDLKHNRLFATPEDYHAVLVYDMVTSQPLAEIPSIAKRHGVLYREDLDHIYVTDGEAARSRSSTAKPTSRSAPSHLRKMPIPLATSPPGSTSI